MRCPFCNAQETKVVDKRETPDERSFRRRRECLSCQKRFTTYERVEETQLTVIKKDGQRKPFDRSKITFGVQRACEKRPITPEQIKQLVDSVEQKLLTMDSTEIASSRIGELVVAELKTLDEVAYVRFASVYRSFADVEEFYDELRKIMKKK